MHNKLLLPRHVFLGPGGQRSSPILVDNKFHFQNQIESLPETKDICSLLDTACFRMYYCTCAEKTKKKKKKVWAWPLRKPENRTLVK